MSFLRKLRTRLISKSSRDDVSPAFSYRIYWTKACIEWMPERREKVLNELRKLTADPGFERNPYRRKYPLQSLEGGKYSGESLACLMDVLDALTHDVETKGARTDDGE